jgi:hypothetical protein
MENQQDQQPSAPFWPLFFVWGGVTTTVIIFGSLLIGYWGSASILLYLLAFSSICGTLIGLSGAGILVNSKPRNFRARRRFSRVWGLFLPFFVFLVIPFVLGTLRITVIPAFLVWKHFFGNILLVPFVFAGSVLGGDAAAQRVEGRSPRDLIAAMFRRG